MPDYLKISTWPFDLRETFTAPFRVSVFFFLFKVKPIKLSRAGIPLGVFSQGDSGKTVKATEDMHAEETQTHVPRNTTRNRDETKEEKKQRKQEIKNDRKVSLVEA